MSGNDTATGTARRSSNSPDLWIPYILIGVACVTFLAIHFWCYHKRNRERYLRKRDEKRVKSGLMERRRITTLMLARYQSDLGITKRERDVDMNRLFYDNRVNVVFDESDDYKNNTTTKNQPFHNSRLGANDEVARSGAENEEASVNSSNSRSRAIANSQTWPLVTERKSTPYNAHEGCGKDNKIIETTDDKSTLIISNKDTNENKDLPTSKDLHHSQISVELDMLIPHQGINRNIYIGNNLQRITETISRPDKSHVPEAVSLKSCSSPTSYPSVFYTSLNSPHSTHTSFLSAFKPKHKKRRYDSSSITNSGKDNIGANETIAVKWTEFSRLYKLEKPGSDLPSIYNASNHSNCYSSVGSEQYGFSETEAFPFAEGGLAYGSFTHSSGTENIQMVPLSELNRPHLNEKDGHSTLRCSSNVSVGKKDNSISSPTIDVRTVDSTIITPTQLPNRFLHQNIVIPFSEKSRLNIISKNPAKIRTSVHGNNPTFWLPRQQPRPITKIECVDNQNSFPELYLPQCVNRDNSTNPNPTHLSSILETSLPTQNTTAGVSFRTDNPENVESNLDYVDVGNTSPSNDNDLLRTTENFPGTFSNYELSTSTIRDLNRSLVFQSTKRKLGVKSD